MIFGSIGIGEYLPGLLCVGGMAMCMKMMMGGSRTKALPQHDADSQLSSGTGGSADTRIAALEAEIAVLREESHRAKDAQS